LRLRNAIATKNIDGIVKKSISDYKNVYQIQRVNSKGEDVFGNGNKKKGKTYIKPLSKNVKWEIEKMSAHTLERSYSQIFIYI